MSSRNRQEWLLSHNVYEAQKSFNSKRNLQFTGRISREAQTISITGGKGGVGKTSVALKMAKLLSDQGNKVLLIDCDYNLSNTSVKLGLPLSDNFISFVNGKRKFEDCLVKDGNFHLLSGCNGSMELFENMIELDKVVIDIIVKKERDYDYILLDCPAGISKETLTLNAYSDSRFIVVTPDKSSITDSYSLIKILTNKYGIKDNHLLVNKVSSKTQYQRLVKIMSETVENFLESRLYILGGIEFADKAVDLFDELLFENAGSKIHQDFIKVLKAFTEQGERARKEEHPDAYENLSFAHLDGHEHDVQLTIS